MSLEEVVEEPLSGLVSLLLLLINTLIQCRPSNFDSTFHYEGQPNDETRDNFCEPSPLISSYWGTLFSTVAVYALGLQSWPLYNFTWWLSYYSWFSSVYYFQLFVYPWLYSFILPFRGKKSTLLGLTAVVVLANYAVVGGFVTGYFVLDANKPTFNATVPGPTTPSPTVLYLTVPYRTLSDRTRPYHTLQTVPYGGTLPTGHRARRRC